MTRKTSACSGLSLTPLVSPSAGGAAPAPFPEIAFTPGAPAVAPDGGTTSNRAREAGIRITAMVSSIIQNETTMMFYSTDKNRLQLTNTLKFPIFLLQRFLTRDF